MPREIAAKGLQNLIEFRSAEVEPSGKLTLGRFPIWLPLQEGGQTPEGFMNGAFPEQL
jgi:hypothetical protein